MTEGIPKKVKEHIFTQIPTGRFGVPAEFAKLSQAIIENPYVNGAIWRIDGAMRLPYL
jgi:NAD(P)-dependent dehydrogenase (short-subunit alcohol dehydrogenase family)